MKKPIKFYYKLLTISILSCCLLGCKKDSVITSSSADLVFSTNSLVFYTVFTTVGSTVQAFTVSNPHNQPIIISSIQLAGSYTSPFKINVDGISGTTFSNIEIPANDSIYVFVTVTINPGDQNTPFIVNDNLNFTTNGNLQTVALQAMGQNATFYYPNEFPPYGPTYFYLSTNTTWTSEVPIVIYGYLVIGKGCTLTIKPGTRVYLHDSAVLYIDEGATLNVEGDFTSPVKFQGDRLEPEYQDIPGQWGEIQLSPLSINNNISWAVIVNGTTGVEADTFGNLRAPTLKMDHTIIKNMSFCGLLGEGAIIKANDCLIADCQDYCVYMFIGGSYQFDQCTFADYWGVYNGYSQRTTPLIVINNYYEDAANKTISRGIGSAFFGNCIIYGSNPEEIGLDSSGTGSFNYYFENSLLKTQHNTSLSYHYDTVNIVNLDPQFVNASIDNYVVGASSPAIGKGNTIIGSKYPIDLNDSNRTSPYTIGAYQQ